MTSSGVKEPPFQAADEMGNRDGDMESERLLERLDTVLRRTAEMNLTVPEETGDLGKILKQVPELRYLLSCSVELLSEIDTYYESKEAGGTASGTTDSLVDIGALISSELAARGISDMAFVARGDLQTCLRDLEQAKKMSESWQLASQCDRGQRRLRQGLIAVESAIHEYEGREGPLRVWFDLETSLEIRSLYGNLRRDLLWLGASESEDLAELLEAASQRFTDLRSLPVYPLLRIHDRRAMRRLYHRICQWKESGEAQSVKEGERIWQDVLAFAELLVQVNRRQELQEHDRRLVRNSFHHLFGRRRGVVAVSETFLEQIRGLLGLDDELDTLILNPNSFPLSAWTSPLKRLNKQLNPTATL
ncbi:MAG: hypothetical protein K0U98_17450 [Deltaproteobacteria bacterium]|nr:hypothetical protein [Deltaproteobacteria bacterium]